MTGIRILFRRLQQADGAATAAEFALVLPLLLLFIFGIIDAGRLMWTWNQAEKATQMGARMAVVTNMVPGGLATKNYGLDLGQGASIPPSVFGEAYCEKTSGAVFCGCRTQPCPTLSPFDTFAFDAIVNRMQNFLPQLEPENVVIDYSNSGLGYSGDPNGSDVAPIVTVRIRDVMFQPVTLVLFGTSMKMPEFRTGLTLEDGSGNLSN